MLAAGAVAGLVGGIAAQVLIGRTLDGDVATLARIVFVMPVATFVAWWLVIPGMSLQRGEAASVPAPASNDEVEARIRRIEATFAEASVPRSGRPADGSVDPAASELFRRSLRGVRRTTAEDVAAYGVRRPLPRAQAAQAPTESDPLASIEPDVQLG